VNTPRLEPAALAKPAAWEHALRFAFGGAICVLTGLVGNKWGTALGGLFLAFPSVLPASLTLVNKHDGRAQATDDARGARLGAVALAAFAGVVALTAGSWRAPIVLIVASIAWAAIATALWFATDG
jgi:uncharacterized protein DUF3147